MRIALCCSRTKILLREKNDPIHLSIETLQIHTPFMTLSYSSVCPMVMRTLSTCDLISSSPSFAVEEEGGGRARGGGGGGGGGVGWGGVGWGGGGEGGGGGG